MCRYALGFLGIVLLNGACIKRTAPPAGSAGATSAAAAKASGSALDAKNARIAGVPRTDLTGGAGLKAFQLSGETAKVSITPITVEGQPFKEASRIEIKEASGHPWAVQITAPIAAAVAAGDTLLASFYLRAEKPQEGGIAETEFVFELNGSPYTKSVSYPVQADASWARVQVRFSSAGDYAAGKAQMIFRLGYEPQTLELGGVLVESFGKALAVGALPSTQAIDRRREKTAAAAAKAAMEAAPLADGGELRIDVQPGKVIRTISPYVYGINSQKLEGMGVTVRRMGGNRGTGYNWELDVSNAGHDYEHQSDQWSCTAMGYKTCGQPGAQYVDFVQENRKAGIDSLVTIPIVDYVAADKAGPVKEADKAPSARWHKSSAKKPGPYTLTPDTSDQVVYEDEFVNLLVQKLGNGSSGGARFYSLDNEPALWPSTHPRIHPAKTRYAEMVERTEATADAITRIDPSAVVLGGVLFGWSEYMTLSDAPDAQENNAKYGTYIDFLLASMKELEAKHNRRLVHALDIHWYPEARGAKRITDRDLSPKTVAARVQAPRSLWDPTYMEKSWIASALGKPIRLIPWLLEKIEQRYPGTKLAMTEYDFGVGDSVSGGIAQADVLGVLGREGVYLANYWGAGAGNGSIPPYIGAAFKLFRNYDGRGGIFGDTAVAATPADQNKASVFAAKSSKKPGELTVIVLNKEQRTSFNGKISVKGSGCTKAKVFGFDGSSPDLRALPDADVKGEEIQYKLAPLSATLFVCQGR